MPSSVFLFHTRVFLIVFLCFLFRISEASNYREDFDQFPDLIFHRTFHTWRRVFRLRRPSGFSHPPRSSSASLNALQQEFERHWRAQIINFPLQIWTSNFCRASELLWISKTTATRNKNDRRQNYEAAWGFLSGNLALNHCLLLALSELLTAGGEITERKNLLPK